MMKQNGHKVKMTIAAAVTMGTIGLFGASSASAAHVHSMKTGNESCVLLAQNGGEKDVTLPHGLESHPLHQNVHKGEPGRDGHIVIGVFGNASDPCAGSGSYVND